MGRLREYMYAGDMRSPRGSLGDPFRFRLPKFIRKFQPGKALKKLAPIAASFIPGGGLLSAAARLAGGVTSARAAEEQPQAAEVMDVPAPRSRNRMADFMARWRAQLEEEDEEEEEMDPWAQFARAFGLDVGDPKRAPKSRRKSAGSGPRAKAGAKKAKRRARVKGPPVIPPGTTPGFSTDPNELMARLIGHATKGGAAKMLMPGMSRRKKRQTLDLTAVRHAARRLEKFDRVTDRVAKVLRKTARHVVGPRPGTRGRGHRAGCKCFACRRAA